MKRHKYFDCINGITFFDAICDMNNLRLAHRNASKGKSNYVEVIEVNKDPETYLKKIREMLINKTYVVSKYKEDTRNENGKERHIYKLPYFPDRIIQWAILQIIGPLLEKQFIHTTYSSIRGRGPTKCLNQIKHDMKNDYYGTQFCFKFDIHHYYASIDHDLLKGRYSKLFKDYDLLWLIFLIIDSVPPDEGVPIGNFLSQYSGNLFLSPLDHFCKEILHCKYYYRYMDDIVILADSKEWLHYVKDEIFKWVDENKLTIKPNYQIFPVAARGIDFIGYMMFHDHVLLRKRIKMNMRKKVKKIKEGTITSVTTIRSIIASYKGFMSHCNAYGLYTYYLLPLEEEFL